MKENCRKKPGGVHEEERREIIRSICTKGLKAIELCEYDWRKVSALADRIFEDAVRALERKDYQEFELNLLLYSDVWGYARERLEPQDFRYFCHGQYKPPELEFQ